MNWTSINFTGLAWVYQRTTPSRKKRVPPLLRKEGSFLTQSLGVYTTGGQLSAFQEVQRNVIIVPHGPLHYLPFTALRNPEGRWLVEDLAIVTVPSASVPMTIIA